MQRIIVLTFFSLLSSLLISQSTSSKISATINDYIEGTSYNKIDRIKQAFYPNAELFLDGKDNNLRVVPIDEYIGFFTDKNYGEFNGRVGRILSMDYFGNIATVKAEILIPEISLQFIDMFILKEIDGKWKIISKTANSKKNTKSGELVLFVVSNASYYGKTDIATGNSFAEIVKCHDVLSKAGYNIDYVSPEGGPVSLAYVNTSDTLMRKYIYNNDFMYGLAHTLKPSEIAPSTYKAIYFVGGGSAVFGVPTDTQIQSIAMSIYENNQGVIASVCHGTAGIVNLQTKDGKYLYQGKTVSGYPDDYESKDKDYYKQFPLHIQESIESRGGKFVYADRGQSHVEVDGRLVTGQNHVSAAQVAEEMIKIMEKME